MATTPITYRRHNCTRTHRTYTTLAKCIWPRAVWTMGGGPYATVAYCRTTTIALHRDVDAARTALNVIDNTGCGGACTGKHRLIRLELAA